MKTAKHNFALDLQNVDAIKATDLPEEIEQKLKNMKSTGMYYFFHEGDVIEFPTKEQMTLVITDYETYSGASYPVLAIRAFCERWGEIHVRLSTFRRMPLSQIREGESESEMDALLRDNVIGSKLLLNQRDWDRMEYLCGKTIKVTAAMKLHTPSFFKDDKGIHPDYNNLRSLTCYKLNEIK